MCATHLCGIAATTTFCGMDTTTAGADTTAPPTDADAPPPVELQIDAFNLACGLKGAYTRFARARLAGVDPATLSRWYREPVAIPLDRALHVARNLDTTVEELWKPVQP